MSDQQDVFTRAAEETTNDWVQTFSNPKFQTGFMWRMTALGILPDGVNPDDARVVELCKKARREQIEQDAARRAYAAGLGASEWEAFINKTED